jgi:hypothetical protein
MPYISIDRRYEIAPENVDVPGVIIVVDEITNAGELNFAITELCKAYFENNGGRYQQINDILGALTGAQLEFYRRKAGPYEDQKIKEKGDVY